MAQGSPAIAWLDERTCWPSLKADGRALTCKGKVLGMLVDTSRPNPAPKPALAPTR